jgi:hypothetical protein
MWPPRLNPVRADVMRYQAFSANRYPLGGSHPRIFWMANPQARTAAIICTEGEFDKTRIMSNSLAQSTEL